MADDGLATLADNDQLFASQYGYGAVGGAWA
jgi:hypothetical protein